MHCLRRRGLRRPLVAPCACKRLLAPTALVGREAGGRAARPASNLPPSAATAVVVFFGEALPERFWERVPLDFSEVGVGAGGLEVGGRRLDCRRRSAGP